MAKKRDAKQLTKIAEAHDEWQFALAAELSNRYVTSYPDDLEGQWLSGLSQYYIDRNDDAKRQIEAALPNLSDDFRGAALTTLARINWDESNSTDAESYFLQAIDADPSQACNYTELCSLRVATGRLSDAAVIVKKGIEAEAFPIEELHYFLGCLHRTKGDLVEAYKSFTKAIETSNYDYEDAESAIIDIEKAAEVRGIELPKLDSSAEVKPFADETGDHVPGQMVANIQREFFIKILTGEKKIEYRDDTDYWRTRIDNAGEPPFHLRIINGMNKNAPELTVVCEKVLINPWALQFELHLGEVIDVKNWDRKNQSQDE